MKNRFKKLVAAVAALVVAFTAVAVTDVTTAKAADPEYDTLYFFSETERATAGVEKTYDVTVSKAGDFYFTLYASQPVGYTVTIYNNAGKAIDMANNPYYISERDSHWEYVAEYGFFILDYGPIVLSNGDYKYGIKFDSDTSYLFRIDQEKDVVKISDTKATITVGFTKKLSVEGAKVTKWSSSKKTVATVDSKGKVTAKKTGKATISAKLDNGKTVKCVVTVKANKYTQSKLTTSEVPYGKWGMEAYSASFDSKGNLVIKTRIVNNTYDRLAEIRSLKITVKDGNGKVIGTYSTSKKSISVPSYSTKDVGFTISKSKLKKKTADLRNAVIICDGDGYGY